MEICGKLVDCDKSGEDQGCEGGNMQNGYKFVMKNKETSSETSYPYTAADGNRNFT